MEIGGFDGLDDFSGGLKIEKISEDDDEFIQNENQKNDQGIIKLEVQEESCQGGVEYFIFLNFYSLIYGTSGPFLT